MRVTEKFIICSITLSLPFLSVFCSEYPQRTLSALIVDDGVTGKYYIGNDDSERGPILPEVPSVPLFFMSDDTPRWMEVPFGNLSGLFVYRGPDELVFYHQPPSPDPDVPRPSVAARAALPDGMDNIVLLFFTENFDERRYRIIPLDDSEEAFPRNTLRIYNFSAVPVAIELGEERQQIAPRSLGFVPVATTGSYERLRMARYAEADSRWILDFSRRMRMREGTRATYLIFPRQGDSRGRVTVRKIDDPLVLRMRGMVASGGEPEEVLIEE